MKLFRNSMSRRNLKENEDESLQSKTVGSPTEPSPPKFDRKDDRIDLPPDFLKKPDISLRPKAAPTQPKAAGPSQKSLGASHDSSHDSSVSHQAYLKDLEEQAAKCASTRELVKKFVADIWNRGELELIPEVCHPGLRFNGSVGMDRVGHDGFRRMVSTIREALNNYHCEIHSMVVEGNKAFVRMRFTGQHTGQLLGWLPTGKQVAWMGATEFTCMDGKILKVWELGDVKSLEEQLSCGLEEQLSRGLVA